MSRTKLSPNDAALLRLLNEDDGAYQFNTWRISGDGIDSFKVGADLQSLKRRGLVDAEGRGSNRQWWITEDGKAAIADAEIVA
jgi:hypothetical protein